MPSASSKTENKGPLEVQDPFKAAQSVVEKKVRNLEKRKGKLEIIREKREQGETLNSDQQKAVDCYDAVITSLEVTRDLQKQFQDIQNELDKFSKKKARLEKKERAEKRAAEVKRVREVLQIQTLLDCMGTESARSDFKSGKNNAKVLSDDNLTQLDEFYKLISPSREEENYEENVSAAAEHIYSYLEAREDEAAGTTYKELKALADGILGCGYFEKYPYEVEAAEPEEPEQTAVETEPETEVQPTVEETPQEVVEIHQEEPTPAPVLDQTQTQQQIPAQQQSTPPQQQQAGPERAESQVNSADATTTGYAEEDSYFSVASFPNSQRPFQDIVSSVQGTFNFLQESQISSESAPHMDPAVVAAQPMHKSQTDVMHGTSFQGVTMLADEQLSQLAQTAQQAQPPQQAPTPVDRLGGGADPSSVANPSQPQAPTPLESTYTPSPQDYSQNLMSQNLGTSSGHTYGDQNAPLGHSHSHSGMDQSVVMGTPDMPPTIPLPNQGSLPDQGISQDTQEKKPFAMNPNAAMFQSMYNTSMSQPQHNQSGPQMPSQMGQSMTNNMTNDKGLGQSQNDYQSNGFGGSSYMGRSSNGGGPRGGMRGGGGRGGRGGMSNGYMRNGSRGGGGGYGSGRGGNGYNSRGGSGRGGTYQGFPPRSDYRTEGGYQGYNNGFSNGSGFSKRGGGSGSGGTGAAPSRNNPGSVRGAGGAVRGGPPRGGSDRSGRGPPRGGYGGRPNSAQQTA